MSEYEAFARQLWATSLVQDPWVDGAPRFETKPRVIEVGRFDAMARAAEAIALAHDAAVQLCVEDPRLLEGYFRMTPWQIAMWAASDAEWHGVARADVFMTANGPRICELNSDTPTGLAEATALAEVIGKPVDGCRDPNAGLLDAVVDVVASRMARIDRGDRADPPCVGIVYPTDLSEDLGLVTLYRRAMSARGWRVIVGAPAQIAAVEGDRVALDGLVCDALFRHYKTDAWGERSFPWKQMPLPRDAAPLADALTAILRATHRDRCTVVNPFGAVLTQNKRTMALLWEARDRLDPEARAAVESYLPYTARLESVIDDVASERARWVLKSDYGCEGEEVVVGRAVTDATWREVLATVEPARWVAQEYFEADRIEDGRCINHGVYVVAGRARGLYARIDRGATDRTSLSTAMWIRNGE